MTATPQSPLGNFGPQRADLDAFLAGVIGSRGPIGHDWRELTARRRLAADDAATGTLEQVLARACVAACLADGCGPPWATWQDLFRRAQRLAVGERLVISFLVR